ncbi:MAG: nuclear transport factor 2 family protein [Candidatus Nanopelagicales bacterium]
MSNIQVLEKFYAAFGRRDAEVMGACYADDVVFHDPAFGELHGNEARAMWAMLCRGGEDLEVDASDIRSDGATGSAHWDATYTFGPLKRKITNRIDASFVFRDGLIVEHRDSFSFYAWSKQAFGPLGTAFGWIPVTPLAMRVLAKRQLHAYMERKGIER